MASGSDGGPLKPLIPLKKRKPTENRYWPRKRKVSSSANWDDAWGFIFAHLAKSVQGVHSLIMLQMVDKNLRFLISKEHLLWSQIYKSFVFKRKYGVFGSKMVKDWRYPTMLLQIVMPTELPMQVGLIPGDHAYADSPERNSQFCAYARKITALKLGKHCGICGARHRHSPYWQLGMRVCGLCFSQNSISAVRLYREYGIPYSDVISKSFDRVYVFEMTPNESDARISAADLKCMRSVPDGNHNWGNCMAWLPHVRREFDLDACRKALLEERRASQVLCAALKRKWIVRQREKAAEKARPSPDGLVNSLYNNERKRVVAPYGSKGTMREVLGIEWVSPFDRFNRPMRAQVKSDVPVNVIYSRMRDWFTRVPLLVQ